MSRLAYLTASLIRCYGSLKKVPRSHRRLGGDGDVPPDVGDAPWYSESKFIGLLYGIYVILLRLSLEKI
jgi:hypothetical protein